MNTPANSLHSEDAHPETPMSVYYSVYGILMVLLVLTVVVAYFHLGALALPIAMAIAITKAALVVWYFMHMKYTGKLMWIYSTVGMLWLIILICSILIDAYARSIGN